MAPAAIAIATIVLATIAHHQLAKIDQLALFFPFAGHSSGITAKCLPVFRYK